MERIRKALDFQVRQVGDPEDRILEFIGSTAVVDRYGDIIEVAGWDLKNYKDNPVFLWAHNYNYPPLGRAVSVKKTSDALVFQIKFASREEYGGEWPANVPSPETVYQLYRSAYLRATSVGFEYMEREPIIDPKNDGRQTGWHFLKQELYELSAVPVPANPEALMLAVQKGIISQAEADSFPKETPEPPPLSELDPRLAKLGLELSSDKIIPALCDLVEDLQEQLSKTPGVGLNLTLSDEQTAQLQAAVEAAVAKAGAVLSAKNKAALKNAQAMIQQVLDAAEPASEEGKGATPNQSIYSLALNPGEEPHGGRQAGESVNLAEILEGTKALHQMICPAK